MKMPHRPSTKLWLSPWPTHLKQGASSSMRRSLRRVRKLAIERSSGKQRGPSRERLVRALLTAARDLDEPTVIIFRDNGGCVFRSAEGRAARASTTSATKRLPHYSSSWPPMTTPLAYVENSRRRSSGRCRRRRRSETRASTPRRPRAATRRPPSRALYETSLAGSRNKLDARRTMTSSMGAAGNTCLHWKRL